MKAFLRKKVFRCIAWLAVFVTVASVLPVEAMAVELFDDGAITSSDSEESQVTANDAGSVYAPSDAESSSDVPTTFSGFNQNNFTSSFTGSAQGLTAVEDPEEDTEIINPEGSNEEVLAPLRPFERESAAEAEATSDLESVHSRVDEDKRPIEGDSAPTWGWGLQENPDTETPIYNSRNANVFETVWQPKPARKLSLFSLLRSRQSSLQTNAAEVHVTWENDDETLRPEFIMVQLYRDGMPDGNPVQVTAATGWTYRWEDLQDNHNYSIHRYGMAPDGYQSNATTQTSQVVGGGTLVRCEIVNTYTDKLTSVELSINVTWKGESRLSRRPDKIVMELLCNGGRGSVPITYSVGPANNWSVTTERLDPRSVWTFVPFSQPVAQGYLSVMETTTTVENGRCSIVYNITNTWTGEIFTGIDIVANVVWDDKGFEDERPNSVQLQLVSGANTDINGNIVEYAADNVYCTPYVSAENNWSYTWEGLDKQHSWIVRPFVVSSSHYRVGIDSKMVGNQLVYTLTYHYYQSFKPVDVTVNIHWEGDTEDKRPINKLVYLGRDGSEPYYKSAYLDKDNEWSYTWEHLPGGYDYVPRPDGITNYDVRAESQTTVGADTVKVVWDITYTYVPPETTNYSGYFNIACFIEWDDNNNSASRRPSSVNLEFLRNGSKYLYGPASNPDWCCYALGQAFNMYKNSTKWQCVASSVPAGYTLSGYRITQENIDVDGKVYDFECHWIKFKYIGSARPSPKLRIEWEDTNPATRPASASVTMLSGASRSNYTLTANNGWAVSLYAYSMSNFVSCVNPLGYTSSVRFDGTDWVIAMKQDQSYTRLSVKMDWSRADRKELPERVYARLQRNGDNYTSTKDSLVELTAENDWSYTWELLDPEYIWSVRAYITDGTEVYWDLYPHIGSTVGHNSNEQNMVCLIDAVSKTPPSSTIHFKTRWENEPDTLSKAGKLLFAVVANDGGIERNVTLIPEDWSADLTLDTTSESFFVQEIGEIPICYDTKTYVTTTYDGLSMETTYEFVHTYTYVPTYSEISVKMDWGTEGADTLPSEYRMRLLRDGVSYATATLSKENNWEFSWQELDSRFLWTIVPDGPSVYWGSEDKWFITNHVDTGDKSAEWVFDCTYLGSENGTMITVNGHWEDEDENSIRPDWVPLFLSQDGILQDTDISLSKGDNWTTTLGTSDTMDASSSWEVGIDGLPPDGYDIEITSSSESIELHGRTYEHIIYDVYFRWTGSISLAPRINVTAVATWEGGYNYSTPSNMQVQLLCDGKPWAEVQNLNDYNDWTCSWENLDGRYTWTVVEAESFADYNTSPNVEITQIPEENKVDISCTLVNTFSGTIPSKTDVAVIFDWFGWYIDERVTSNNDLFVEVALLCDGEQFDKVKLNNANQWQFMWKELDGAHTWTVERVSDLPEFCDPERSRTKNVAFTKSAGSNIHGYVVSSMTTYCPRGDGGWDYKPKELTFHKLWFGMEEGELPDSIVVEISGENNNVTLRSDTGWKMLNYGVNVGYGITVTEQVPTGYLSNVIQNLDSYVVVNVRLDDSVNTFELPNTGSPSRKNLQLIACVLLVASATSVLGIKKKKHSDVA